MQCLATCHSITYVGKELIGDPLDVKMFEATGYTMIEGIEQSGGLASVSGSTGT